MNNDLYVVVCQSNSGEHFSICCDDMDSQVMSEAEAEVVLAEFIEYSEKHSIKSTYRIAKLSFLD